MAEEFHCSIPKLLTDLRRYIDVFERCHAEGKACVQFEDLSAALQWNHLRNVRFMMHLSQAGLVEHAEPSGWRLRPPSPAAPSPPSS
jgi:hypothetical protein